MITSNAGDIIRQIRVYRRELRKKEEAIVSELVDQGREIANNELDRAKYTGYLDAQIEAEAKKKRGHVSMVGYDAGFVEFGTGMTYVNADQVHPKADEYGAIRGEWGNKEGANPPWIFHDEPGNAPATVSIGKGKSLTFGIPANRTMYNTGKELHERLEDIVKDVFDD